MPNLLTRLFFTRKLLAWYRSQRRDLPWRRTSDPYKIWISEVMLQQTTVKAVIPYFERWVKQFPDVKTLAQAKDAVVLKTWQGLGYYSRARNLHKAARIIVDELSGKMPDTAAGLRRLPGFGPYTSAAVASIAFGRVEPLIDANVLRVMQRILAAAVAQDDFQKGCFGLLAGLISQNNPGDFNQALMELGALVCRSKEPVCDLCPVRSACLAYEKGLQEVIPKPKTRTIKAVQAVIAIIRRKNKVLVQKRPDKGLLAGLWEFPGGKVEASDKTLKDALKREIKEELGVEADVGASLGKVVHAYTNFRVTLNVFEVALAEEVRTDVRRKWVIFEDLKTKYAMPSGSVKILEKLTA